MAFNPRITDIRTSKDINNTLLTAMDDLIAKRTSELTFDKTIIAEIVSLEDAETQRYKVRYQSSEFSAYGEKGATELYRKGNSVYVKIPGGNFSSEFKRIEGRAYQSAAIGGNVESTDLNKAIIEIGYAYQENEKEYSILAGPEKDKADNEFYESVIYEVTENDKEKNKIFVDYFNLYKIIQIKAYVRTEFIGDFTEGNYGLKVEFFTDKKDETVTRILDLRNFVGSLYGYPDTTPQMAIYDMSVHTLTGIKKITLFQEKFADYDTMYDMSGENILIQNKTKPNIFFNKISIAFIDIADLTKNLYHLGISAPQGLSLVQESDKLLLEGKFFYSNKDIMSKETCICYWYEQDARIMQGSAEYDKLAGNGWKKLPDDFKGLNFNKLTVTYNDVYQMKRYKLVVVYNTTVTRSAEITVKRAFSDRFDITKTVEDKKTILTLLDASTSPVKGGLWYTKLPDGTYLNLTPDGEKMSVDVTSYTVYPQVDIYCAIDINNNTSANIETKPGEGKPPEKPPENGVQPINEKGDKGEDPKPEEKPVEKKESQFMTFCYVLRSFVPDEKMKVYFEGPDTFLYDAKGDVSYEMANLEQSLIPTVIWANKQVPTNNIKWYDSLGAEITSTMRPIPGSMLNRVYVEPSTGIFHYTIRQKYADDLVNNIITCKIETNNETHEINKEFIFLKQGDQGTNGSTLTLVVRPCEIDGNLLTNDSALIYDTTSKKQIDKFYLKPMLYENGKDIISEPKLEDNGAGAQVPVYKIEQSWIGVNLKLTKLANNIMEVSYSGELSDKELGQYFVKCILKLTRNKDLEESKDSEKPETKEDADKQEEPKEQVFVYTYPVLFGVNIKNEDINLLSIPTSVMYNNAGEVPVFNRNKMNFFYEGKKQTSKPVSLTTNTLNVKLYQPWTEEPPYYILEPVEKYDGATFYEEVKKEEETPPAENEGGGTAKKKGKVPESPKTEVAMDDPMGAIKWPVADNANKYVIQPVVMSLSKTNSENLKGWNGERVDYYESNPENATEPETPTPADPEQPQARLMSVGYDKEPVKSKRQKKSFVPTSMGIGQVDIYNKANNSILFGYEYIQGKAKERFPTLLGLDKNSNMAWKLTGNGEDSNLANNTLKIRKKNWDNPDIIDEKKMFLGIELDPSRISFSKILKEPEIKDHTLLDRKSLQTCLFTPGTLENSALSSAFKISMKRYHYDLSAKQNEVTMPNDFSIGNAHLVFYNGILLDEPTHGSFYPNGNDPQSFIFTFTAEEGDSLNIIVF